MAVRVDSLADSPRDAVVGILGGTGPLGRGLASRWTNSGVEVLIGSRDSARAQVVAAEISGSTQGLTNREVSRRCQIAVLAIPWNAVAETLDECGPDLAGKLVVSCVNPLAFDERGPFALPVSDGSAVEYAARQLPDSTVVGAFHHLSSERLADSTQPSVDCDVMVVGEDRSAVAMVVSLANLIPGVRGFYAGRLRNGRQVEALTANLIALNRRYRVQSGIRVTGVDADAGRGVDQL